MHQESFQKLESAWRSLKFLVDRTDFRENNRIEILNVSKQALLDDFEDAPDITRSGLYKAVYTADFGQFGGEPFGRSEERRVGKGGFRTCSSRWSPSNYKKKK